MAIDYEVTLSCAVKQRLGRETMLRLLKGRNQAMAGIRAARDGGDDRPVGEITFGRVVLTQDIKLTDAAAFTAAVEVVSAQTLLEQAAVLDPFEHNCTDCPVNLNREPFGCMPVIHYPIPAVAETWLLDRLPPDLDNPAGNLLKSAIVDLKYSGKPIREMRAIKGRYFEEGVSARRTWGRKPFGYTIMSDQLLEMMISLGELQWSHCYMLTTFFGIVPLDLPPKQWRTEAALYQTLSRASLLMQLTEPRFHAWALFLRAIAMASVYHLSVWVDT
jgi:hypothetical protein